LRKLCKAYSSLTSDEWDDLPATTNAVESINRQIRLCGIENLAIRYYSYGDTSVLLNIGIFPYTLIIVSNFNKLEI